MPGEFQISEDNIRELQSSVDALKKETYMYIIMY